MKPKQRGGKRAGAGSPPKYTVETCKIQIPLILKEQILKLAEPYLTRKK